MLVVEQIPWVLEFEPDADIAIGAVWVDTFTIPFLDFVCTHIGFTAPSEGFPAGASRWKIGITDVGNSRNWQPHRWSTTAMIGGNHGMSDSPAFKLSKEWRFTEKQVVRVEIENDGNFAGTPQLILHGYLDSGPPFQRPRGNV